MRTDIWADLAETIPSHNPEVSLAELRHAHALFENIVDGAWVDMNYAFQTPSGVPMWYQVQARGNIAYYCNDLEIQVYVDGGGDIATWIYFYNHSDAPLPIASEAECRELLDAVADRINEYDCLSLDEAGDIIATPGCAPDEACIEVYNARDMVIAARDTSSAWGCFDALSTLEKWREQLEEIEKERSCI